MRLRIFLALLACASTAFAQQSYTLEQAIDTALRQNRDLAALQLSLGSTYYGVEAAEAPFGLSIRPDGHAEANDTGHTTELGLTATRKMSEGAIVETGARAGETDFNDNTANEKHAIVHVQIRQPLFRNFGTLINREPIVQAKNDVLSARRRVELQKADLIVQVVEIHEDLLRLQQQLAVEQLTYKRFDQLYRLSQLRERQGHTTRVDTLRAEFERGRAGLDMLDTTEHLSSRRDEMANVLALPPSSNYYVALPGPELKIAATNAEEAVNVALSSRLDVAEAIQDWRDAARGVAIARRELLPDLNVLARYDMTGKGASYSDATALTEDNWFVGFSGDTDYPPRSERAALGRAKITEETAEQKIRILTAAVRLQVQQALLAYDRSRKQVLFSERNHALANDRARLARRMFTMGRETSFNVSDAETGLLEAESQVLASSADVSISAYRLLRVLGTLIESPDDLRPGPMDVSMNNEVHAP